MTASKSLSARSPTPQGVQRQSINKDDDGLKHAPESQRVAKESRRQLCNVKAADIKVSPEDNITDVTALLHVPQNYHREQAEGREKTAAILIASEEGGVLGPKSMYLSIADKVASLQRGVPVLRLDQRYPARTKYCVADIKAAMDYLHNGFAVSRFVVVGWGFGSAPAITAAAEDDRIVACATIAGQLAETEGIEQIAKRSMPVLFIHGMEDRTLSPDCSRSLSASYERSSRAGTGELAMFEGGDHELSEKSLKAEELLCNFIVNAAGDEIGHEERMGWVRQSLLPS